MLLWIKVNNYISKITQLGKLY